MALRKRNLGMRETAPLLLRPKSEKRGVLGKWDSIQAAVEKRPNSVQLLCKKRNEPMFEVIDNNGRPVGTRTPDLYRVNVS
jgi:hypothetical protein